MPLPRAKLAAVALALLLTGGVATGMRCLSATAASCSVDTLFGGGPALDVPYAGTRPEAVARMLDMAQVGPGDRVVDLGTGDGRILLAAARRGARGLGVDIDPVLVDQAGAAAIDQGVAGRAEFRTQDLFDTPLAGADVVTMFLLPHVNLRLRPRILAQLRPGARVVSHSFTMGDWIPDATDRVGGSRLYLWVVPAEIAGTWRIAYADGRSATLALQQRYQQVSGTLRNPESMLAVAEPRLEGDRMAFLGFDGTAMVRHEATVRGNTLVGTLPRPGWRAQRVVRGNRPW